MLSHLRDLHVWMTLAGANVPVFNRPRSANANPNAFKTILGDLRAAGRSVRWAVTTNQIGYIAIFGWSDRQIPQQVGEALEPMRNTRGLIVDVRLNGGGSEPLAAKVAGRFLKDQFVYAYSQFRNGASHTNLTEKYERTVEPCGPWRYNRPVLLLIGQKCMSSNESFIGMMTGDPQVTTMGDHTCGSSGNPKIIQLPLDITVSVPRWIDYLPDGTPLDERGFQPQVPFKPTPGAFEGERDDLLTAALDRLSLEPLPARPIKGPEPGTSASAEAADLPDYSQAAAKEAQDESRPKVIAVTPTNDASGISTSTELRIRFDRPMDRSSLKLSWNSGGFLDCEFPRYDAARCEFIIPVHLAPGVLHQVVVNKTWGPLESFERMRRQFPRDGFQSADYHLAGLFAWRFRTADASAQSTDGPPRVTHLSPATGGEVPIRTFLEIQFDQPMASPSETLPYLVSDPGGQEVRMISRIQYDSANHTFRIPLLLAPNRKVALALGGFRGASGKAAETVKLQFAVTGEALSEIDRTTLKAGSKDSQLLELLQTMQRKRAEITSLSEHVQTLTLNQREGTFVQMSSQSATFKWQEPDQFYADVAGPMQMCTAFEIGSDGSNCWWHEESDNSTNLVVCPANEMDQKNVSICDPFGLTHRTPATAIADRDLNLASGVGSRGDNRIVVESWDVNSMRNSAPLGCLIQWRINPESHRLDEATRFFPASSFARSILTRR